MLVISRFEGESFILDGCIEVSIEKVTRLDGRKKVRLGITAPREISIHRKEVQDAINRESILAAGL